MYYKLGLTAKRQHPHVLNKTAHEFFHGIAAGRGAQNRRSFWQLSSRIKDQLADLDADVAPRAFWRAAQEERDAPRDQSKLDCLWAGDAGTQSHTHYDASANFFVQLHGTKRFELWPPERWPSMALHPKDHPAYRQSQLDSGEAVPPLPGCPADVSAPAALRAALRGLGGAERPACAAARVATVAPGEVLYVPPFWFHRVASLSASTALSSMSNLEEAGRFSRAVRAGLPYALADRAAPRAPRAACAHRFLSALLLQLLPAPADAAAYVSATIGARHAPLAEALRCDAPPDAALGLDAQCGDAGAAPGGGDAAPFDARPTTPFGRAAAGASDEEQYYAAAAARELRGRGRAEGAALDATGHILLQDYLEYVGGFAVGMEALCAFFARCFP
eukprot:Transcript_24146.p2 GENE.Transcript_24146~~Transcript_24146.p2  ORF type:complete len:431 (+),score=173.19 Transcript_24146:125-1294(+)